MEDSIKTLVDSWTCSLQSNFHQSNEIFSTISELKAKTFSREIWIDFISHCANLGLKDLQSAEKTFTFDVKGCDQGYWPWIFIRINVTDKATL